MGDGHNCVARSGDGLMPGFFALFFRAAPEPEPEAPKPKKTKKAKKAKKVEKSEKGEKAKPFVHPLKSENARLMSELESLRNPEPEPEPVVEAEEPEDDESS